MRRSFLAAVGLALSCMACSEQTVVTLELDQLRFHGSPKRVRGIPVKRISRDWCKAAELKNEIYALDPRLVDGMAQQGFAFAVDGFLDGTDVEQTALVGVYETCAREKGGFLLILDKSSVFTGRIRFLWTYPHKKPFDALQVLQDGTLEVAHCTECDFISYLKWDKATATFVWQNEEEETPSQ